MVTVAAPRLAGDGQAWLAGEPWGITGAAEQVPMLVERDATGCLVTLNQRTDQSLMSDDVEWLRQRHRLKPEQEGRQVEDVRANIVGGTIQDGGACSLERD